jgi:PAS domain S-box-containing protein
MQTSLGSFNNPNINNFHQEIILQAPVAISIVEGSEFIISISNEKNLELWQKTQEEVLGKPLFDVFPETKTQPFYGFLTEVYQTGVGIKLNEAKAEFYRNGVLDTAWFDINYEPIKNEKGEVYAIMVISVEITSQVLARKKVENSESELQQMADAMPHLVWRADGEGNITFYNKRVYEYTGLNNETDKNFLWNNIIHPDDFEKTQKDWIKAVEKKTFYSIQHRIRMKNGLYRWFLSRAFCEENIENKTVKWFGSSTDVHEQKLNELKIKQTEEFNRTVLESNPDCLKVIDKQGRIQYMNYNGQCLMEIDDFKKIKNKQWSELWGEENVDLVKKSIEKALSGENVQFIAQTATAKGKLKWWDVMVSPVNNPNGEVKEILSISRDITLQKQIEDELHKTQERLNAGLKIANVALSEISYITNTVQLSPESAVMYGFPENQLEVTRLQMHDTFHPAIKAELEEQIVIAMNPDSGGYMDLEHPIVLPSGKVRWLKVNKQFFYDHSTQPAKPIYSILVSQDITERKEAQEQLAETRELLERTLLNVPSAIYHFDKEGNILYANELAAYQMGYNNVEELLAEKDFTQFRKTVDERFELYDAKGEAIPTNRGSALITIQSGKSSELVVKFVNRKTKDSFWLLNRSVPLTDEQGNLTNVFTSCTDISEQKFAEENVEESRKLLELTLHNVPSAIYHLDKNGNILYLNELAAKQMGYDSVQEVLAIRNVREFRKRLDENFLILDENGEILGADESCTSITLKTSKPAETTIQFIDKKQNTSFWLLTKSVPLLDEKGELSNVFTTCTDITAQKQSQEAIQKSERRYRRIFENTPISIWEEDFSHLKKRIDLLTQQGVINFDDYFKVHYDELVELIDSVIIKDVNAASLKLYGCSKEEILQGLRQFYTDEALHAFVAGFKLIAQGGGHYEAESIVRNKAGKLINLMVFIDFPTNEEDYSSVQVIRFDITERKKIEETLKYRKALLEAQNEAIPDAILIVDSNGKMLSLNKNFAKIWGMPDDIIAKKDDNAALEYATSMVMDPEGFIERVKYCYAHPEIKAHDEILLKDGRILDRYGNAVVGEDGTNYGWAWYFRDITEQKKSEQIIKESEQKYRGLFEKMEQGFCIIEVIFDEENNPIDYRFVETNPTFKQQTGLNDADGKTMRELVPDIEISWSQIYGKVALTGESTRFIDYSQAMNTWFEVYAFRLGDATNNKVAILFSNITEIKKAEQELKASETKFKLLTETIPQMVWMTDQKGVIEYISSQWSEYTGIMPTSEEDWAKISHPEDTIATSKIWEESLQTGKKLVTEARLKSKEGEFRWHLSVGVPFKNDKGEITKWIGSVSDIHDQKLKEQKKDEFISIASHEMKTPLTSAKAYLQLMEMSLDENDDAYLYTKKASDAVGRLNKLITELLDASKIQHGKLNYTNSAFDFDMMVADTIENVQYSSATHKISKRGAIKKQFLGDKDRLQQVIINLLTNAIKYSPNANEVTVEVQEENNHLQVSVIDKGIGMPEKHLDRIFERYYRVEEHSVQFQGLGIGLYISYDIIKRHNGKMWVESSLGEGSTFHFTLPFIN